MACTNPRGHRWVDKIDQRSVFRALNVWLIFALGRRVCRQCGAKGCVDKQGKVQLIQDGTRVNIVPLARRAKWAQKKTEHDR